MFDLPPITVRVTEHYLIARRCECGVTTCGTAPDGVTAPAQYGPRITAIILYLYVGQFLSMKHTAHALGELFGTPVPEGAVAAMIRGRPTGWRSSRPCGVSEVGPVAVTSALGCCRFVLVDKTAEDGLAANLCGTLVWVGAVRSWWL